MLAVPIISNPLLVLLPLRLAPIPPHPPPSRPSHAKVQDSNRQNNNSVSRVVRRVPCKIESQPTVDYTKQEDCRPKVSVDLGERCGGVRLLPGAVVEEAKA
jgi:hypothetical protein